MTRKNRTVRELHAEWMKDPEYVAAWEVSEEEFSLADALIAARSHAEMTQEEVAAKMGTSQAAVARLEGGRSMPSTRTLQRYAEATGSKLRIRFDPSDDRRKEAGAER